MTTGYVCERCKKPFHVDDEFDVTFCQGCDEPLCTKCTEKSTENCGEPMCNECEMELYMEDEYDLYDPYLE